MNAFGQGLEQEESAIRAANRKKLVSSFNGGYLRRKELHEPPAKSRITRREVVTYLVFSVGLLGSLPFAMDFTRYNTLRCRLLGELSCRRSDHRSARITHQAQIGKETTARWFRYFFSVSMRALIYAVDLTPR